MVKLVVRSELPWLEVVPLSPVLVGNGSGDLAWYQPGSLVPGCQHRRSTQSSLGLDNSFEWVDEAQVGQQVVILD